MAISIPATTIRFKYLKSIPVMSVYQDPNGHKYQIQEKKINQTLTKVGTPYFGNEEGKQLTELDPKHI